MVTLKVDNRLLAAYLFYGGILLLKMLLMSLITTFYRLKNKALPSPEDYGEKKRDEPVPINDDVERVRRAHRNDLENIPTFLIIALLFMLAGLCPTRGIWCLRIFTAARIVHTLSYLSALSKPRAAGFLIGLVCTIVLGVSVLLSAAHAGSF